MPEQQSDPSESIAEQIQALKENLDKQSQLLQVRIRRDDTGAQKVNTEALLTEFQSFIESRARKIVRNWILGLVTGTAVFGGGGSAWYLTLPPSNKVEPEEIKNAVEHRTKEINKRVEENTNKVNAVNKKIRNLGRELIRIGDSQAEGIDYLSEKLEAISKRAKNVEEPPTVKKRRLEKRREQLDKRVDELMGPEE